MTASSPNPDPAPASLLRTRLRTAACVLLASGMPAAAHAEGAASNTVEASVLVYAEQGRARVVEPAARISRLFANGHSLSLSLGFDTITGASPTGAVPTGSIQTTTSPSGQVTRLPAGMLPVSSFSDHRISADIGWQAPLGRLFTTSLGGHFSREKDYQSLGLNGTVSVELMNRLTTVTLGGGYNSDRVFPDGGTHAGLGDGAVISTQSNRKHLATRMLGISRILTRRWMMGLNITRSKDDGYLTEPYKVVSVVDGTTGETVGQLTEERPDTRDRSVLMASSVYHLATDVVYLSYRYYWDNWGVKSHTFDGRYRYELGDSTYLEPHARFYTQTRADFFTYGLVRGAPLPAYASGDIRLGPLRSVTVGATCGFRLPVTPGEWTVRAEYIRQFGDGHPASAIGAQRELDLFPAVNMGTLVVGYSFTF
ncbi:MAG: DUF3570 domain-containing protein [Candidatus Eisenbacteria bacterium]|nr:DUF3570 domain-containing protein [Candidatus Eisenbacteria bacterium]